jgi:cardiolipin synthase
VLEYSAGNSVTLLRNGELYFPALVSAIDAARSEIYVETYIYADDQTGSLIADALARAAVRGVATHLLIDGFGGRDFPRRLREKLSEAGVRLLVFRPQISPWPPWRQKTRLRRMHRKLASIDCSVAFVGGINIIDDYHPEAPTRPQFDYAVRVEGPIAARVREVAAGLWARVAWAASGSRLRRLPGIARMSGRAARAPAPPPTAPPHTGGQRAALVLRDSLRHRRDIEQAYFDHIDEAREEILIANAYFFPGRRFRRALAAAARRGVRVTLLAQGLPEFVLLYYASWALYDPLLAAGVRIYEYQPSLLHAKVAVFDRRVACVGSSNIEPLSLLMAREANVFVDDPAFAQSLRADLQDAIEHASTPVQVRSWTRLPFRQRLRVWLSYRVARLLLAVYGYDRFR